MAWKRVPLHLAALFAVWTLLGSLGYLHHMQTAGPAFASAHGSRIVKIAPLANGAYSMTLRNGATVTTGRLYRDVVLALLGGR